MAESSCEEVGSQLCAKDETIEEKNYVRTAQTRVMGYSEVLNDKEGASTGCSGNRLIK